jgi:hypothetical protein
MMDLNINVAPFKTLMVDGKTYSVRNLFAFHEPRPDLDATAPENVVDGASGGAFLRCVNVEDEDDTIFVPIDASFTPFDLVWVSTRKLVSATR